MLGDIQRMPSDANHYGLIHADLAPWNFAIAHDGLTAFDFDSSAYAWFADDRAVSMYYAAPMSTPQSQRVQFLGEFLPAFLAGYRSTAEWHDAWADWIEPFLLLQCAYMTAIICHEYRSTPLGERIRVPDPGVQRKCGGRKNPLIPIHRRAKSPISDKRRAGYRGSRYR